MRHLNEWVVAALLLALFASGCGDEGRDMEVDGDDTDSETEYDGPAGTMSGTVLAPNGAIPISSALVYISGSSGPEIPDNAYCYECEDMTGKNWTLSSADGTWHLDNVPAGQNNLIVRKGFFQRQRNVTVEANSHLDVPAEYTTLPSDNSADGLDQIPNYAVLMAYPDQIFDLLAKIGLGQLSGGSLQLGTETFDIYNDDLYEPGYEDSEMLFFDDETLNHYHMIFLPCSASAVGLAFADGNRQLVRDYVAGGGKIYNSCCVAYWTEPTFPDYMEFYGDDASYTWDVGRISPSPLGTTGEITDAELRDWFA
ncbi:MAG: carboxypeptidase regulatory-like domain-containing protein, partial [Deltaproteobacteria bacterium]|nr:carboxypeptidase regulatory-like domain-containing protein [Deltaproteobacteria bacterium]